MSIIFNKYTKGFSLIEVAIVMLILGFVLGGLMVPMSAQRENNNIKQARQEIKIIQEAIYGFAIASARMPCTAQPGSSNENCPSLTGFVPAGDLGIEGRFNCDNLLLDPWGNPYRYSVTSANTQAYINDISAIDPLSSLAPDLRICRDSACTTILTSKAVAVIYSMGSNWNTLGGADETANAETTITGTAGCGSINYRVSNNPDYVDRDIVETGNTFNDIVSWISNTVLLAKLLAAGQI